MAGIAGTGTLLKLGSTDDIATATYTTIADVTNISGPTTSAETIDVTSHSSTASYREYVPSFLDAGEMTVEINFDPNAATHKNASGGLLYEFNQRTKKAYQIVWPDDDATECEFVAYVTGFQMTAPMDDKLSANVTLRLTGQITWTYAT